MSNVYTLNDVSSLNNLLVHQKDKILELVNNGQLATATAALAIVKDFWLACDYGYKHAEIERRITEMKNIIAEEQRIAYDASNWQ